ncbi:hypothetical protein CEE36_04505 [candidate division TA06 bacterium B3_TA06]|uniref:DUF4249 domain-containing protein n=1 Tax=candidate division TA06 bacterium B3_TA06 TaxID=2012487 RepID=A0A532V7Y8_UNCT6|nr:MAG: hypothetical protein CEE36_04505 [candidate division TA06 bacterium B3_TA06]
MKRLLLLGLTLLLFARCESSEDYIFESQPNILALMRIKGIEHSYQYSEQVITVNQSYDIKDTVNQYGVRGAQVTVWGEDGSFFFFSWRSPEEDYRTKANFNDTTLYHLEVALPWDDTVTAEAYMPSPIQISSPADSDTVSISAEPYDPHVITWNSCKNTELYALYCIPDVDDSLYKNYPNFLFFPSFTNDTSYAFFLQRALAPWIYDEYYVLRVMAVSPEYAAYMGFFGPGEVYSNLSAGYGMFGGIAEDSVRVYIVE